MYMDKEKDEENYLFNWVNIEASEDYILLEERGCSYELDDYETGEYAEIIRYLQPMADYF